MKWACGLTTVEKRRRDLLPRTLASLKAAGFDRPRLFVDGDKDYRSWEDEFGLDVTTRPPPALRTFGNWVLGLYELYIREPAAERYAMFQDDLIACRNLRQYLESCPYPEKGYLNLYTFPQNQELARKDLGEKTGWFESNQRGLGAVGLVFNQEAVTILLTHYRMVSRPMDPDRGWQNLDGGVLWAMKAAEWKEYCHHPSLVQHTGDVSSIGHHPHPKAPHFPGEDFDATTFADWRVEEDRSERGAIERALKADEESLAVCSSPAERQRLLRWVGEYKRRLRALS